jgi:RNA polymerase sigma-70 factor (ECF subfamily)
MMDSQLMVNDTGSEVGAWRPPAGACEVAAHSRDEEMIDACGRGDRSAQHQLYLRHCQAVYRLVFRIVGSQAAEEVTQQVFLRLFQSIDSFAGRSRFSTWLYRLAANEALQYLRRKRSRPKLPLLSEPVDKAPARTSRIDEREMLEYALSTLDPDLRAIFLLREVEGLSYYDIALALDIAEGTVASRLNRARRLLREALDDD